MKNNKFKISKMLLKKKAFEFVSIIINWGYRRYRYIK